MARADSLNDPVEKLLFEALDVIEREGDAGLEALCRDHPDRAEALRRRLEALREAGLAPGASADDSFPERLGDFHLLDRLGQGGMGVVYRARQQSLGREVALKLVRPDLLYFPGARARFRREVETIGALQHPGIVPIHTVGEEDGIPYYAMELVRGATLGDVVRALAGRSPDTLTGADFVRAIDPAADPKEASPIFAGSWTQVVLRIVREVAESLEHAHRRGVVHRDVKPSNVMVTTAGRVLLVDFGLASTAGVDRVTRTGSQLGTLPYMSPEQLDGAEVDGRTDVYSLGAVLYELLTLAAPYAAKTIGELLTAVRSGSAPRVSNVNRSVPWELDVVTRTALAPERERRYASAALLARDLDNVLENRPIEARRSGPVRRFWRWSQRHPSAAVAIVLAVLAVLAGPAGFAVRAELSKREVQRAWENEQDARAREEAARASSEASYAAALDAVGYVLRTMAAEDLRSSPMMQDTRLLAIDRALAVFEDLGRLRPDDERLRFERARIVSSRGEVLDELGRRDEAVTELARASELLTTVVDAAGAFAVPARRARGVAHHYRASALSALGRSDESRSAAEQALADLRRPAVQALDSAELDLAAALDLLSTLAYRRSEFEESERVLREALAIARAASEELPGNTGVLYRDARTHGKLAITLEALGRLDEALEYGAIAVGRFEMLHEELPDDRLYKGGLAHYLATYGRLLGKLDRHDEALPSLERSLVLAEELVRDYPENKSLATELIAARTHVAMSRHALGHTEGIPALFEANVRDAERMLAAQPDNPVCRYELAAQRHNRAMLLTDGGPDEADWRRFEELERATLADTRALLANDPRNRSYRTLEHRAAQSLAAARCELGTPDEARRALEDYLALGELDVNGVALAAQTWARLWMCLDRHDMAADERERRQAEARTRMYAALERAVVLGLRQASLIERSPVFEPFLHEPRLQRLLADIETL